MFKIVISLSCLLSTTRTSFAFKVAPYSTATSTSITNNFKRLRLESIRGMATISGDDLPKTEEGWRTILNPEQFRVLRQKSTEPSGFSERTTGQLEYELKKKTGTKYPTTGRYKFRASQIF